MVKKRAIAFLISDFIGQNLEKFYHLVYDLETTLEKIIPKKLLETKDNIIITVLFMLNTNLRS